MEKRDHLKAFLNQEMGAEDLFSLDFRKEPDRICAIHQAQKKGVSSAALSAITKINSSPLPKQKENLEKLSHQGVVTVIAGQQIGFAGGAYLTVLKAVTAVKAARDLEEQTGVKCVPIFWMQTEDHDYKEIESTSFYSEQEGLYSLMLKQPACHDSVGKIVIDEETSKTVKDVLDTSPLSKDIQHLLEPYHKVGTSLPRAFQQCMQHILGATGILFFDPLQSELDEERANFFPTALGKDREISELLLQREDVLLKNGFHTQVKLKKGSPLFFMSWEEKRQRLTPHAEDIDRLYHQDTPFLIPELLELIKTEPHRFTSSALLRPLFQDTLFPTAITVAGPAEFRYLSQIKPLYPLFGLKQPLILPRSHCTIISKALQGRLKELGLTIDQFSKPVSDLVFQSGITEASRPETLFSSAERQILGIYDTLASDVLTVAGGLKKSVDLTRNSIITNLSKFRGTYERTLLSQHKELNDELTKIQIYLFPNQAPQERTLNIFSWGETLAQSFIHLLGEDIRPFEHQQRLTYIIEDDLTSLTAGRA